MSKYLFPLDRSAFCLDGAPAPMHFAHPEALAAQYPESVQIRSLGCDPSRGSVQVESISHGQKKSRQFEAFRAHDLQVIQYKDASSVGRHCSIVGPENCLVADFGYYLADAGSIRHVPLGRLNPLYWRYRWQGDLRNRRQIPAPRALDGIAVALNNPWCHNYYHWMMEVIPRLMLVRQTGIEPDWYLIECQSRYQQQVLELLGVPRHKWIQPHYALNLKPDLLVRPSHPGVDALKQFASSLIAGVAMLHTPPSKIARKRIYISRKSAQHRKMANEPQLEKLLSENGFESYCFEHLSVADQVNLVANAEAIVAVHGAALANLMFAQPGTPVIEICPIDRYNPDCFPRVSQMMGLQHMLVMADSTRFRQNLLVDLDDMRSALDLFDLQEPRSVAAVHQVPVDTKTNGQAHRSQVA